MAKYRWEYEYVGSDQDYESYMDEGWEPFAVSSDGPWVIHLRRLVRFVCGGCGRDIEQNGSWLAQDVGGPDHAIREHWVRTGVGGSDSDVKCEGGPVKRRPVYPKPGDK